MATAHLIVGLPCSGKSTYAAALQEETDGLLFTLDRWLIEAYGKRALGDAGHAEHVRRVLAIRGLIWNVACQVLARGIDVILDDGFFLGEHRRQAVVKVNDCGAAARIHYLNTPMDLIQERLNKRNDRLPEYNFYIDPALFMRFVALFEAPSQADGAPLVVIDTGRGR